MNTKRRQSSAHSEELFEFVDYTSVSHFERLVTAIEETIYSWGIKDGSDGIFSDECITKEFIQHELLSVGDETYKITYNYYPISRQKSQRPLVMDDLYLFTDNVPKTFHPLHRWTGFSRFLVFAPLSDSLKSKLFSSTKTVVDLQQAKSFISACAIAAQNTGCRLPVFIQVGQLRHHLYIGYMLGSDKTEIRFNTIVASAVSSRYTHLDGLRNLFRQKLEMRREDQGFHRTADLGPVDAMAVFSYNVKNWFDEDWKDSEEDLLEPIIHDKRTLERPIVHGILPCLPSLPFGPFNDPLRTLTLNAIFPLTDETAYSDSALHSEMDALTAKHWRISHEFGPSSQQRSFLSSLLTQAVYSWVKDPTNREYLAPYDNNNKGDDAETYGQDNGLVRNLLNAMGQTRPIAQGSNQITVVKSDQLEQVLSSLFQANQEHQKTAHFTQEHIRGTSLFSAHALVLRIKYGAAVPYRSFLWNFLVYSLHTLSDTSKPHAIPSYMGFLRILWIEILRQIRWHWEHLVPIPNVSPYLYQPSYANEGPMHESSETVKPDITKTLGIDLRFNRLHQKLAMINCCIYRRLQEATKRRDATPKRKVKKTTGSQKPNRRSPSLSEKTEQDLVISDSEIFFDSIEDMEEIEDLEEIEDMEDIDEIASYQYPTKGSSTVENKPIRPSRSNRSSVSDVSDTANPHSMSESFVRLNYSPNTDSDNYTAGLHFPHHNPSDGGYMNDVENEIQDEHSFEGRDFQHPSLRLIKTYEPMWIPHTQNPGFMTEDMIEQQTDVFENLGTSEDATHIRAKLQSAQLYSDMQSFKAANPHSTLEDFVRWHSPKDWIKEDIPGKDDEQSEIRGQMSARMGGAGNIWQELWKCSRRIPWDRQKPLFNTLAEGEKALHYLESMPIHETFSLLLPTVGLIAYDTLVSHPVTSHSQPVIEGLSKFGKELVNFPWEDVRNGKCTMDSLISMVKQQETLLANAISLLRKLPRQYSLVDRLLVSSQTYVKEGEEREVVFKFFRSEQGTIAEPYSREYVLYSDGSALAMEGRTLPERQYTIIKENEVRIIEMHTTDTICS
ncbi:hypothetical protein PHYBLDRAFT_179609 [Phycomyces blakesleeanus NRRL 1555(-)]|uniref:Rab3 GTPase-activating protein catalytic subunit n=2 Tax=Phycomyces blakesleeanus TaxID=4837 RepID=A0A167PVB8_PHYB8|nr:hypothetical protein PHYBLDRAFT_179609 [Phycomyces blakesleeanus NRRL 1555(-)]OAD78599.1 hypothetical protein PHYBLDRAFT_179609 [Phycomyces blakesleeanus NRRL 1555(-)]|eukprot:XP_018296639.1 hypothetical protein PHYBLDRAFT_179609 [Phycomyces blakesleeanus NRRL 1555(-)]